MYRPFFTRTNAFSGIGRFFCFISSSSVRFSIGISWKAFLYPDRKSDMPSTMRRTIVSSYASM